MSSGSKTKTVTPRVTRLPVSDPGPIRSVAAGTLAQRRRLQRQGGQRGTLLSNFLKDLVGAKGFLGA